jgi:hypothetical protein
MFAVGAIFLCPDIRDLPLLGVLGKLLVEGMMSLVRHTAQVYCLLTDWTGGRLLDDPDVACQRIGQDTLNAKRARRLTAWWQAGASSLQ